jgi:hypothetical protein
MVETLISQASNHHSLQLCRIMRKWREIRLLPTIRSRPIELLIMPKRDKLSLLKEADLLLECKLLCKEHLPLDRHHLHLVPI